MTKADFHDYKPRWSDPLVVEYGEHCVYSCPPPLTGGVTVLAMLRSLDGVAALDTTTGRDPKYIDLVGRAVAVYPRVSRRIADVSSDFAMQKNCWQQKAFAIFNRKRPQRTRQMPK